MEEYIPVDVETSKGDFVGKIKEEYDSILKDIINSCTVLNVFKSKQSKEIKKDEFVSYGRKFKSNKLTKIVTVFIGYADGIPRN